ncbi:SRPBCC domain-containing protein [Streptomyces melanogenes]|uniref:SRPBCC domain-containing protein n=1 Tax=Streptomyces melanogenes TaxID=67326 RepID=A0ABZ1XW66_9ACTN|nr:SRPBCC domain-containing protein [Streptomyces melanogenes]
MGLGERRHPRRPREVTLEPDGEDTLLRLVHTGLPSPEACAGHSEGWHHYLDRLAVRARGGDPGPDRWTPGPGEHR